MAKVWGSWWSAERQECGWGRLAPHALLTPACCHPTPAHLRRGPVGMARAGSLPVLAVGRGGPPWGIYLCHPHSDHRAVPLFRGGDRGPHRPEGPSQGEA